MMVIYMVFDLANFRVSEHNYLEYKMFQWF